MEQPSSANGDALKKATKPTGSSDAPGLNKGSRKPGDAQLSKVKKLLLLSSGTIKSYQLKNYELQELTKVMESNAQTSRSILECYQSELKEKNALIETCNHLKQQYDLILEQSNKFISKEVFVENDQLKIKMASLTKSNDQLQCENLEMRRNGAGSDDLKKESVKLKAALDRAEHQVKDHEHRFQKKVEQMGLISKENVSLKSEIARLKKDMAVKEAATANESGFKNELSKLCAYIYQLKPSPDSEAPGELLASSATAELERVLASQSTTDVDALLRVHQEQLQAAEEKGFQDLKLMKETYEGMLEAETRALKQALANAKNQNEDLAKKFADQGAALESALHRSKSELERVKSPPPSLPARSEEPSAEHKNIVAALQEELSAKTSAVAQMLADASAQKEVLAAKDAALQEAHSAIAKLQEELEAHEFEEICHSAGDAQGQEPLSADASKSLLQEELVRQTTALENANTKVACLESEVAALKSKMADCSMLELDALMGDVPSKDASFASLQEELRQTKQDKDTAVQELQSSFARQLDAETASLKVLLDEANSTIIRLETALSEHKADKAKIIALRKELESFQSRVDPNEVQRLASENAAVLERLKACQGELAHERQSVLELHSQVKQLIRELRQAQQTSTDHTQLEEDKSMLAQQLQQAHSAIADKEDEIARLSSSSMPLPQDREGLVAALHQLLEAPNLTAGFKNFVLQLVNSKPTGQRAFLVPEGPPADAAQEIALLSCENKRLRAKYMRLKDVSANNPAKQLEKAIQQNKILSSTNRKLRQAKQVLQDSLTDHMVKLSKLKNLGNTHVEPDSSDLDYSLPSSPLPFQAIEPLNELSTSDCQQPPQRTEPPAVSREHPASANPPTAPSPQQQPHRAPPQEVPSSRKEQQISAPAKRSVPEPTRTDRPPKRHLPQKQTPSANTENADRPRPKTTIQDLYPYNPSCDIQTNISLAIAKFPVDGRLFSTRMAKFKQLPGQGVATAIVALIGAHASGSSSYELNSSAISFSIDERNSITFPPGCMSTWEAQLVAFTALHTAAFPGQASLNLTLHSLSKELVQTQPNPLYVECLARVFAFLCKLAQDSERLRILLYDLLAYGPQNPYLLLGVSSLAQVWGAPLMATSGSSNLCIDVFQGVLSSVFPLAEESLGKDLAARYYTVLVKTLGWQPHDNQVPLEQTLISLLQGYEDPASSPDLKMVLLRLIGLIRTYSWNGTE